MEKKTAFNMTSLKTDMKPENERFWKGTSSSIIFQTGTFLGSNRPVFGSILNPKLSQIHLEVDVR